MLGAKNISVNSFWGDFNIALPHPTHDSAEVVEKESDSSGQAMSQKVGKFE